MTEEYRRHLCDLLESYAPRFRLREPVVCLDEKSGHLLDMAEIGIGNRDRHALIGACLIAKPLRGSRGTTPPAGVANGPSRGRMQTQDGPASCFVINTVVAVQPPPSLARM